MLIHPSQHPRDGFHEELHEALDSYLDMFEYILRRLIKRLGGPLDVLDSLPIPAHLHKRHSRCDRGDNGLAVEAAVYGIQRLREAC